VETANGCIKAKESFIAQLAWIARAKRRNESEHAWPDAVMGAARS